MKMHRIGAALAAVALLSTPVLAQGSIEVFGPGTAQAISADGGTVVGGGPTGNATTWSGGVETNLGELPAVDVSGDGNILAGGLLSTGEAARWTGAWAGLGTLDMCGASTSTAYAMDNSGDNVVGLTWDGCAGRAFLWTPGGGMEYIPQVGINSTRANAISGDGTSIGGWDEADSGPRRAAVWSGGTEQIILEGVNVLNPEGLGEVWGFSTDGEWAVGNQSSGQGPFRWNATTGAVDDLPQLAGGGFFDVAVLEAINDAGNCAVGWQGSNFGTPFRATIWTEEEGLMPLRDWVISRGIAIPPELDALGDFAFGLATDMTPDGTCIVGYSGDFFTGQTAWKITLEEPECFLVIGDTAGNDAFNPGLHNWNTQVGDVQDYYAVLLDNIPEFVLPSPKTVRNGRLHAGQSGSLAAGSFGGATFEGPGPQDVPEFMADGTFTVQVLMWNPGVFPQLPEQFTTGLVVTITPSGDVVTRPYGESTGMEIWHELDVNENGDQVIRFPFSIPGF